MVYKVEEVDIDYLDFYEQLLNDKQEHIQLAYDIYIPSKGRHDVCTTVYTLSTHSISSIIVVEPQDYELYKAQFEGNKFVTIEVMDKNNQGISYVRNWIKNLSKNKGDKAHYCIDDNIRYFGYRTDKNRKCHPLWMFYICERLLQNYSNIGGLSFCHDVFAWTKKNDIDLNKQIYSCVLLRNIDSIDYKNNTVEDTDYSLQMLSKGYCTLLMNRFIMYKQTTMILKGGNTEISYSNNGRLLRSKTLVSDWPSAKFKMIQKKGSWRIQPSTIWKSFKQTPINKNMVIL